jgi:thiamine biosynthesis lipoprotein
LESAFNTVNSVTVFTLGETDQETLKKTRDDLNGILRELDDKFNVQDRDTAAKTDLMRVNENAGVAPVEVDREVIEVLEVALTIAALSKVNGVALYDPTIMPVADLWDITNRQYNMFDDNRIPDEDLPTEAEITTALALVNYRDVEIDKEENTVFLKKAGMKIDLGSIVKGYAADKIKAYLLEQGFTKAIIDIGRNIQTVGQFVNSDLEDAPWKIGIQRPYATIFDKDYAETQIIGVLEIADLTVVTSGIYEKYIYSESGKQYHHIFNPRTGYPMENDVVSVTVICAESVYGDALSTTLFLLGIDRAMEMIASLDFEVETLWVLRTEEEGKKYAIYVSAGLADIFDFNEAVESKKYVYKGVYNAQTGN